MSEAIVATIEKVEPKNIKGKDGNLYTLYVVTAGGKEYTTFNADWLNSVGQERTIEFERVRKDKYENLRVVEPKKQGKGNPAIARIESKVDEALKLLRQLMETR